ncbi:hypothetical protein [Thioclava indica]|uniref:Type I secretion protein n=1 Tax=Thioclava indica TaxID=1353528 RepID=A0A074JWK3_9RHOB|nr:hypothetical protein [Thioclava indica]KEO60265.1 hypothetical protein DT23_13620 [Thioclava indica]
MLDRQTEIIAHFIGAFQLTTEQLTSRHQYDVFRAQQLVPQEQGPLLNVKVHVTSDYALQDFTPGLRVVMPPPLPPEAPWLPHSDFLRLPQIGMPELGWGEEQATPAFSLEFYQPLNFFVTLAPPSSVATVTFQANHLLDDDRLINVPFTLPEQYVQDFSPEAIAAKMAVLIETAETLGAPSVDAQWLSVSAQASALRDTLDTLDTADAPAGAEVAVFHNTPWEFVTSDAAGEGDTAELPDDTQDAPAPTAFNGGVVVNGQIVSDAPDTLSARLEARYPDTSETEALPGQVQVEDGAAGTVNSGTLTGGALSATMSLSTGDNLLLNQTQIAHDWIDAPVIAVAGMAQSLSLISQINVLRDYDTVDGGGFAHGIGSDPASQIVNIATQETLSNPASFIAPTLTGGATMVGMVCIKGDLVIDNTTYQINEISDSDVVSYEFGTHQAEISLGDNSATNLDLLLEIGSRFDVIMVGGDMIQMAAINQINVLLDDDLYLGDGTGGGLYSGHDNLLWNEAGITHIGTDSVQEMSGAFQSALGALGETSGAGDGSGTPSGAEFAAVSGLFADPLLAGLDTLRVLWIEGDLLIRDTLTQINLLTDSDVISVALPGDSAGAELSAGDNILANVAGLSVAGVDSTIMAGEGSYSDAVLYQAGMFEGDQSPLDLAGTFSAPQGDLASEAVVFLTDDFNDGPGSGFNEGAGFVPDTMNSGALDALHSVLA